MTSPEPQVHISIGSRFEHIDLIQIVVDDALGRLGLDEDGRHWVGIAVREAVANAIKHGNKLHPEKNVEVELAFDGEEAIIQIEDSGRGFDPEAVDDPLAPENLLKPNGRGIFYMKNFMDHVEFTFRPEGGTVLTLRKRITRPGAEENQAPEKEDSEE